MLSGRETKVKQQLESNFVELFSSASRKTLTANASRSDITGRLSSRSIGTRQSMVLKSGGGRNSSTSKGQESTPQGALIPFSLRSFLCSAIMMSHATVLEKIETLFDIFDFVDGTADGNTPQDIFEMIQTVF